MIRRHGPADTDWGIYSTVTSTTSHFAGRLLASCALLIATATPALAATTATPATTPPVADDQKTDADGTVLPNSQENPRRVISSESSAASVAVKWMPTPTSTRLIASFDDAYSIFDLMRAVSGDLHTASSSVDVS